MTKLCYICSLKRTNKIDKWGVPVCRACGIIYLGRIENNATKEKNPSEDKEKQGGWEGLGTLSEEELTSIMLNLRAVDEE